MASEFEDQGPQAAARKPVAAAGATAAAREERAVEIFGAIIELEAGERAARLHELCGGDAPLLHTVQDLLRHHDDPAPVLRSLLGAPTEVAPATPATATTIGPYDVLGVLGRGGMGIVYRAVQKKPRRTVALKVLSPARVDVESIERFEREIEVLGLLQHPGICRIHDAGAVDLGLGLGEVLYFAMELVDGVPVTQFAARERLDVHGRCALVASICDAVHHAHRRGVIHRDLKPNNILVIAGHDDVAAQPKVLDFGIARTLGADMPLATATTRTGSLLGTLQYMSPEQLLGESHGVDARTDIYSLGVILYELLAGRPPLELADQSLTATCRVVSEREPTPLGRIDKNLRGDLEVIASKALAKQRDDRYGSAAELADDLRRYVRGEPILARPQTTLHHVRRFARRHRTLVGGVLATLLALAAGLVAVAILAQSNKSLADKEAGARAQAEAASARLRRALYGAQMRLSSNAFTVPGGVARAREVLAPWRPSAGDNAKDLRGFEWYLLDAMAYQAALVAPCEPRPFDLWWLPGEDTLFSCHWPTGVLTSARTGQVAERFDAPVRPLALSVIAGDRSLLVQSTTSSCLVAMDPRTRTSIATFEHGANVLRCALSTDGTLLAVSVADGSVVVWHARTGQRLVVLAGKQSGPLEFSRDGALLAAASEQRTVRVWRTDSWSAPYRELRGPVQTLFGLSFDAQGKVLATCSHEGWLRLWDVEGATQTTALAHPASLRRVAFAPHGAKVAVACEDYAAYVHDLDTKSERQLCGHGGIVATLAWSPSGDRIATMSDDHTLRVWDLSAPPTVRTFTTIAAAAPHDHQLAWNANGDALAVHGYAASSILALNTGTAQAGFAIAIDGGKYTARCDQNNVQVWANNTNNHATQAPLRSFAVDNWQEIAASAVAPSLAVGARGVLYVWHFLDALAPTAIPITDVCRGLAWCADGKSLALVDGADVVQVFDTASGQRVASQPFPQGALELDCAPHGDAKAVACVDQVIRVWSPSRGLLLTISGHASHVLDVAWSPDGRRLASGGQDRTVKVFDAEDGAELLSLPHEQQVSGVAWGPDGQRLASIDTSGRLKVWDATAGYARARASK